MKSEKIFTSHTILGAVYYLTMMLILAFCSGCGAQADSKTDSPTFTMSSPAPYPVLNAITDNPVTTFTDERDSLKIMEVGAAGTSRDAFRHYQTELTLEAGREYSLLLHVHNDADGELRETGIAENVHFTLSYPTVIDGDASLSVLLSADNTTPMITSSSINLHTSEPVTILFEDEEGNRYPVICVDYALNTENAVKLAVATAEDGGNAAISGNIGSLLPGNTKESGAYVYLRFRAVVKR